MCEALARFSKVVGSVSETLGSERLDRVGFAIPEARDRAWSLECVWSSSRFSGKPLEGFGILECLCSSSRLDGNPLGVGMLRLTDGNENEYLCSASRLKGRPVPVGYGKLSEGLYSSSRFRGRPVPVECGNFDCFECLCSPSRFKGRPVPVGCGKPNEGRDRLWCCSDCTCVSKLGLANWLM